MKKPLLLRQRRSRSNNTITYLVLIVLIVIFLSTVGLQFVINTSLLIAGYGKSKDIVSNTNDDTILVAPEIVDVPTATNSAQIVIQGTAQDTKSVLIFLNDEDEKDVSVDRDGVFETRITLQKGKNTLYAQVKDTKSKQVKNSDTYIIEYSNEKPTLSIETPQNDSTTFSSEIDVKGKTDGSNTVKVNNIPVVVNSEGNFRTTVRLNEGDNTITISAHTSAGNSEQVEIKVKYQKD